ncbi:MAG: hypothetical protein FJ217_06520 [Ignavibacteria bacterium]|nr:hypothetical protein [Ignavibacteria bacterium]
MLQTKRKLTVREYFENHYFKLFFDDSEYLQSPANTPLFQLIAQKKTKDAKARKKSLDEIHSKIETFARSKNTLPDMSFAIGYPSADMVGTTSGQVSNILLPLDEEDMYASWIGSALGIGIEGGLNVLIDNDELMSILEEGWTVYRSYVDQNDGIDNKIETWNGIWLCHRLSEEFDPKKPTADFKPVNPGKKGEAVLERLPWTRTLFTLARKFPKSVETGYVYSFGQMNKTVGFVSFNLPEVKRLADIYRQLFGKIPALSNQRLDEIYQAERGFGFACEQGVIGLRSIEPKGLRKFMPGRSDKSELPKEKQNLESQINNSIYISWIVAMLNNKDLLTLAEKGSAMLRTYVVGERQARTTRSNTVAKVLDSKNRRELVDALTLVVEDDSSTADVCSAIVNAVMLSVPNDSVPLFVTLMRFKFALAQH